MANKEDTIRHWLALLRAPHIGPAGFRTLIEKFSLPENVLSASEAQLAHQGLRPETILYLRKPDWARVDEDMAWLQQPNVHVLLLSDDDYPRLLKDIADPPPMLFVRGDVELLGFRQLAMVGSRNPTPAGRETAADFARYLAANGLVVTSGLALGIDAVSHDGALKAGGATIAVAGTGLDRIYPARHKALAHRIVENGAIVSEFPPGTPPLTHHFPRRNRIISGLSMGVLVVEAALRSGSLITARQAIEQGREVFAVPGSIHNPQARGCNALIRQGAKLVETAQHIFEELGGYGEGTPGYTNSPNVDIKETETENLDPEYKTVMDSVGFEPTAVDKIVERSGLTADAVCSMLLVLELQGLIATTSSGHYCRSTEEGNNERKRA